MEVRDGGLGHPEVEALLAHHRAEAHASTPARNAHALDSAGLAAPDVTLFTAWDGKALLGVAALRMLDSGHAELKSMRTHPGHLRRGGASALLARVIKAARARHVTRLSLETGTHPMFAAANALYARAGFTDGPAFGGYPPSVHNRFMTMVL